METTTQAAKAKNARWGLTPVNTVILANQDAAIRALLGGKTLAQAGEEFDLADDDIEWYHGTNAKDGSPIESMLLRINGLWYNIALSRGMTAEIKDDVELLLKCKFRAGYMSVKEEDGVTAKTDEEGNIVLNESKPYLSFGKPEGILFKDENREKVFQEPVGGDDDDIPSAL